MNIGDQIEEMAQAILEVGDNYDTCCEEDCITIASLIYDKGYRKSSDVAEEIFAEIDRMIYKVLNDRHYIMGDMYYEVEELKNKYESEKEEC